MQRICVGFRVHRYGADAKLAAGLEYPAGNLTAIGYEQLLEHQLLLIRMTRRNRRRSSSDSTLIISISGASHTARGQWMGHICMVCRSRDSG